MKVAARHGRRVAAKVALMQRLKKKAQQRHSSSFTRSASGLSTSYLKTRIRGSRLPNAARILLFIELSSRLHQAYRHAYNKQAAEWLLPQNPAPTQQGGPCDQTIRNIFADDDAQAAASGFEPTGFPATDAWRNGQNRSQAGGPNPNQWGHLNGYSGHIYGSSPGTSDTTLYVPGNFSSYTPPSGNDAVATFFYRQLGNQRNVTLAVFHVGNFGIQRNNTNNAGSVRIGTSGGLGGDTVGYRHSHLEVHRGRGLPATMRARNRTRQFFSRVFCR